MYVAEGFAQIVIEKSEFMVARLTVAMFLSKKGVNATTPLLLIHGTEDSLIPPVYSELTVSTLRQLGMDVQM